MAKALFFDIDGTLYDFHGNMPASTQKALEQAKLRGHQRVICSGRSIFQIYPAMIESFDAIICSTGAMVKQKDKILYEHFLPKETIEKILSVFETAGGHLAAMTEQHLIMNEKCLEFLLRKFKARLEKPELMKLVMGDYEISDDLTKFTDIKKVMFHDSNWEVAKVAEALSDCCDVTASSFEEEAVYNGEITARGINKSLGMQKYMEYMGISREDTIAFGDGPNDLDMVEFAGIGVAMGNGTAELKQKADFVTTSISEDGIYHAMKTFGII